MLTHVEKTRSVTQKTRGKHVALTEKQNLRKHFLKDTQYFGVKLKKNLEDVKQKREKRCVCV